MLLQLVSIKGFSSACQRVLCPHDSWWGLVPFSLISTSLSFLLFPGVFLERGMVLEPNELSHKGITRFLFV